MAASVALTTMISDVREYADMVGSQFVSDATITRHLNLALRELYDRLIAANGNYYETKLDQALTSGTSVYALPAAFYKLIAIERYSAGFGSVVDAVLNAYQPLETPRTTWAGDPNFPRYRIAAGNLEFLPSPGTLNVRIRYIPTMTDLSSGSDTFDGINGFEKWATLEAACQCMMKEESDVSNLRAEQARVEARIQQMATERDAFRTVHIVDVTDRFTGYWDDEDRLPRP